MRCRVTIEVFDGNSYTETKVIHKERMVVSDAITDETQIAKTALNAVAKTLNSRISSTVAPTKIPMAEWDSKLRIIMETLLAHPEGLSVKQLTEITENRHAHAQIHKLASKYGVVINKTKIPNYTGKRGNFGYTYQILKSENNFK